MKIISVAIAFTLCLSAEAQTDTSKFSNFDYLEAVVISTDKGETSLKESTVGMSILRPYLVENKITINASTAIEQVPGVVINDDQVNIRSGSGWSYGAGSRVMVTIDGMPMITGDAGSVPFSFLPTEGIGSIEVIKNAGSVLYGSSAVNGAINMRSAPITSKPEGQISMFGGYYDIPDRYRFSNKTSYSYGLHGFYREKIKEHSIAVTWNQVNDDSYRFGDFDNRLRMGWRYGYQPKKFPKMSIWLNGNIQRGESGSFLLWQNDSLPYRSLNDAVTKNTGSRFYVDPIIHWKGKWKHTLQNRFFRVKNDIDNGDPNNNQDNQSDYYFSEWRSSRSFKKYWTYTGGLVNTYTVTNSPLFQGSHTARNHATYSQIKYKSSGWIGELGARYEYFNLDGKIRSKPVFRAGINKQLGRATFIRASYGEGFRFPSMAELFTSTSTGGVTVLPNDQLEPESSQNIEIGVKQGWRLNQGIVRGYVDVSGFSLNVQNLMEYTFYIWNGVAGFKPLNISPARIRGFEIESGGQWASNEHKLKWFLGYTYTLPKMIDTNAMLVVNATGIPSTFADLASDPTDFMKYRNRHIARADIEYNHLNGWVMGLSYRYQSGFENMDFAFLQPAIIQGVNTQYRNGAIDGHVIDIRGGMQVNQSIDLILQVRNVTQAIFMGRPADMSAPRMYQLMLTYHL